jgi:hypothetical protein
MPNYPTHARWGRVGAVVTALAVGGGLLVQFGSPLLAGGGALGAAAATFAGAVFPDVDHHRSIPRRKAVRMLRLLVVVGVSSLAALRLDMLVDVADTALGEWLGGSGVPAEVVVVVGRERLRRSSADSSNRGSTSRPANTAAGHTAPP